MFGPASKQSFPAENKSRNNRENVPNLERCRFRRDGADLVDAAPAAKARRVMEETLAVSLHQASRHRPA
jgi:hypothetical protein